MNAYWNTYGNYKNKNYGTNALVFSEGGRDYYFSYKTLVAVRGLDGKLIVRANEWGPTTGKHLNAIDGGSREAKKARLSVDAFQAAVASEKHNDAA